MSDLLTIEEIAGALGLNVIQEVEAVKHALLTPYDDEHRYRFDQWKEGTIKAVAPMMNQSVIISTLEEAREFAVDPVSFLDKNHSYYQETGRLFY